MQVTLKEHIKLKSAKVAYNLHTIHELQKVLSKDTTKSLVYMIVSSHMDYCNSVMAGLPTETLKPLQRNPEPSSQTSMQTKSLGQHYRGP